jgi:hypothetical protein
MFFRNVGRLSTVYMPLYLVKHNVYFCPIKQICKINILYNLILKFYIVDRVKKFFSLIILIISLINYFLNP